MNLIPAILTQQPPALMDPVTAFLVIVMVIILAFSGFGIVIILGTIADWANHPGDGDR